MSWQLELLEQRSYTAAYNITLGPEQYSRFIPYVSL